MDFLQHTTSWVFNKTLDDDIDIHMFEWNDNNSIQIAYDYKTSLYDENDIKHVHARILHIIDQVLENESILLKNMELSHKMHFQKHIKAQILERLMDYLINIYVNLLLK